MNGRRGGGADLGDPAPALERTVDVETYGEALLDFLATAESGRAVAARDAQDAIPLYELTAALISPVVRARLGARPTEGDEAAGRANLVALMGYLFDTPGVLGYDPWRGMIEWLRSRQVAWDAAALADDLGAERVRALSADEYQGLLAAYRSRRQPHDLRERWDQFLQTYIQELARTVVAVLDLDPADPLRRDVFLGATAFRNPAALVTARPLPLASDALSSLADQDTLAVMNGAHYQALREALYKGTFVEEEGTPWPTAALTRGAVQGQAQLRPPGADRRGELTPDQIEAWSKLMWDHQKELSDLDADALDALSALWLAQARSSNGLGIADVDGMLLMRGVQPRLLASGRRKGYYPSQREDMQKALAHIQNIWLNIATFDAPPDDEGRGQRSRALQSRAFIITDRYGTVDETGTMVDMERFIFRPGEVFARFLLGPGQQTALLSAKALHYDGYRQTFEKRLARFFSWQWPASTGSSPVQAYRVEVLLDAVGKAPERRRASPFRERFEAALDTLQRDGVIAGWQYDDWDESATERRDWLADWRACTVLVTAPETIVAHYRAARQAVLPAAAAPPADGRAAPAPEDLGALIKARRLALGWHQEQVAAALGISQGHLSKLERGKLAHALPSPKLVERVHRWLAEPAAPVP